MTLRVHPDEIVERSTSPLLDIHNSWERVRLNQICELKNGGAFPSAFFNSEGHGIPLIRIRDVGQPESKTFYSGDYGDDFLVFPGDLVVGMDGDFRVARWNGQISLLNQRVCRLRVKDTRWYDQSFLYYVLPGYLDAIHAATSAVTVKHLSSRTVQQLPLPLPPLAHQQRIVERIEKVFTRLDEVEATLMSLLEQVRPLLSSILSNAFHADGDVPPSWTRTTIGQVAEVQLGRQRSPKHHVGKQMRPYLRAGNVTWSGLLLDDIREMNFDDGDFKKYKLYPGDILLNESSGSSNEVGKPVVWNGAIEDCCFQNHLLRLRPHSIGLRYLYWYCYFSAWTGRFGEASRGVNIRHLGKRGLTNYPIPVAPREQQRRIVERIEGQLKHGRTLESLAQSVLARLPTLRQSVLAEAFAGRLVPQDPDDKPASVLESAGASAPRKSMREKTGFDG